MRPYKILLFERNCKLIKYSKRGMIMKEIKSPKKPLIYYYCIALAVIFLLNNLLFPKMLEMQIKEVDYGTFLSMLE